MLIGSPSALVSLLMAVWPIVALLLSYIVILANRFRELSVQSCHSSKWNEHVPVAYGGGVDPGGEAELLAGDGTDESGGPELLVEVVAVSTFGRPSTFNCARITSLMLV